MYGFLKWILCCFAIVYFTNSKGQTYIGTSVNIGNQLSFTPESEGIKKPFAISGNLFIRKKEKLNNEWVIQYSAGLGILGYSLKIQTIDTLMTSEVSRILDYSTFYGQLDFLLGKEFLVKKKKVLVGAGFGATYYMCSSSVGYGVGVIKDDVFTRVFSAEIDCSPNSFSGFAKITTQLELNSVIIVGLAYTYHFSPALTGSYEFYHTNTPSSGAISLYQREINFIFLVRISKME